MADIKSAFNAVCAGDKLKENTLLFIRTEIAKRQSRALKLRRISIACASFAVLALSGFMTHRIYSTPVSYVDLDVNPSIELSLNSLDRVIDYAAYNGDGDAILEGISLKHERYEQAIQKIMEKIEQQGYINSETLVSVTLQTSDSDKEQILLSSIQSGIETFISGHHSGASIDVFPVSSDTRNHSHEQGVSPAKYIAIQELIELDPSASVQSCREHTISEIKELTNMHGGHHGQRWSNDTDENAEQSPVSETEQTQQIPPEQNEVEPSATPEHNTSSGNHGRNGKGHGH